MPLKSARIAIPILMSLWAIPAQSYDVLLNVRGVISGNTCTLAIDSQNITVPLGKVANRQFLTVGAVSQIKTPFTIRLEECGPTFEGARVTFSGEADGNDSRYLKIDDGEAAGVAVEIMDSQSQPIPLNTSTNAYRAPGEESLDMLFYARLIATQLPVKSGKVTATATYTVEYL